MNIKIDFRGRWEINNDKNNIIYLLKPEQLKDIPDGTKLTSILGDIVEKGKDTIDEDTRYGFLAFGLREVQL